MSKRFIVTLFAIAALIFALVCWLTFDAGSVLWGIVSGVLMILSFIGYFLCSRCPHCGRVIHCTSLSRPFIYCHYCGKKVDLTENPLRREDDPS